MMLVLFFLAYFTLCDRLWVHPYHYKWPNFFPFCGWVILVYLYIFFIHSFVCGHLGWFPELAVVTSAAVNDWGCCCSVTRLCPTLLRPPWTVACQAPLSMGFPRQNKLDWAAIPFSRGSLQPRDGTHVSCIAGGFFTAEPLVKPSHGAHVSFWIIVCSGYMPSSGVAGSYGS